MDKTDYIAGDGMLAKVNLSDFEVAVGDGMLVTPNAIQNKTMNEFIQWERGSRLTKETLRECVLYLYLRLIETEARVDILSKLALETDKTINRLYEEFTNGSNES